MKQSVRDKIVKRIYAKHRGWVFTPNRFLDLGSRRSVDEALSLLEKSGTIRHLARGLYDYPASHPKLGTLSAQPDAIAKALSESESTRLQPSGAYAINLLGLSQQVPAKYVYLTDGASKQVQIGNLDIQLKQTTPKNMKTAGHTSGLVIQAFRYLKQEGVSSKEIAQLKRTLSREDKLKLWKDRIYAPAWMHEHFKEIAEA
ncbi:MAG: DUF6088 family protein [Verrucomicrobiota bacterium]